MPEDEITQEQQSNEPAVLTKAENPGLFEAVCNQLGINYDSIDRLSPRDQERLYKLDIKAEEGANVTSLNGIEKLTCLRCFGISGSSVSDEMFQNIYRETKNADNLEQALFVTNQVTDFSPLQKCSNLRICSIRGQHNVQSFDVGNFKELETLNFINCDNLWVISNLTEPMKNGALKELSIKYSEKFGQITDEENFINLLKNGYAMERCTLDHGYFMKLMRRHPELRETMENMPDDKIKWADLDEPYSTKQMLMIYDRIADIVNTVCQECESDIQKLANVYRYFCDTMTYNHSAEEQSEDFLDPSVRAVKIANRRALDVLFNNTGVCAGFSNIFNLCGTYLGFNMETCPCTLKNPDQTYESDYAVYQNHEISRTVWYSSATGEKFEYYFDLTNDLGRDRSIFFMLNRDQILLFNQFSLDDLKRRNDESAPGLQRSLDEAGLLRTSERNKLIVAELKQQAEQGQIRAELGLEQDDNSVESGVYVTQMPQNVEVLAQGTPQEFCERVQNLGQDFSERVQPVGGIVQENQPLVVGQEWGQTPKTQQPVEQTQGIEYQPVEQVFVEQPTEFTQDDEYIGDPNYTNYEEPTYYAPLEQVSQPQMPNDTNAYNYQNADYNNANYQYANNSLGQGGVQVPTAEQMQADGNGQGAGNSVAQEESMVR